MICRTCGEKVLFGFRDGSYSWLHRESKDHLGDPMVDPPGRPEPVVYPEPEVRSTPVEPKDDRVPGGVRTITNLLAKQGWELVYLGYSRGPYVGAKGQVLSISDFVLLKGRGPVVDGMTRYVVASWRDGKFDLAYVLERAERSTVIRLIGRANATNVKDWIKGQDVVLDPPKEES